MSSKIERRYTPAAGLCVRENNDNQPVNIRGYAALFNTSYDLGWFQETIQPGAFAESLANGDDVRGLFNHDSNLILGRSAAGTLELGEDEKGLWYDIKLPDTQLARDLVESIGRGDITQSSFAFETIEDEWHTNDGQEERILVRVKLWDVSPVTYPANPATTSEVAKRSHAEWRLAQGKTTARVLRASLDVMGDR